jgi:hypothetical protein
MAETAHRPARFVAALAMILACLSRRFPTPRTDRLVTKKRWDMLADRARRANRHQGQRRPLNIATRWATVGKHQRADRLSGLTGQTRHPFPWLRRMRST